MPKKLPVVGVYALMGAGKTLAVQYLSEFTSWQIISADEITHRVLMQDEIKRQLISYFGPGVLTSALEIDRLILGQLVFKSIASRKLLERCVWPSIKHFLQLEISKATHGSILDAAVLVRARWSKLCHRLIYIDSREKLRTQRLLDERGLSETHVKLVFQAQSDIAKSKVKADYIIKNNETKLELRRKMEKLAKELLFYFPDKATSEREA